MVSDFMYITNTSMIVGLTHIWFLSKFSLYATLLWRYFFDISVAGPLEKSSAITFLITFTQCLCYGTDFPHIFVARLRVFYSAVHVDPKNQ